MKNVIPGVTQTRGTHSRNIQPNIENATKIYQKKNIKVVQAKMICIVLQGKHVVIIILCLIHNIPKIILFIIYTASRSSKKARRGQISVAKA